MGNVIGTADVDITPAVGGQLAAYQRESPSTGILDRLRAVSFFVSDGSRSVSITSVDIVAIGPELADRVRGAIADYLGIDRCNVLLHATHTHSSPWGAPRDDEDQAAYLRGLERQLVDVARRAAADPQPCLVSSGTTDAEIGENRRQLEGGEVVMGVNPDGPVDRRLGTLAFRSGATGELLAVLVTGTAHANVLKADSMVVSGDFPSWTCALLERSLRCPVMFVQGAAGDVNAVWRGDVTALRRMAWATAGATLRSLADHEPSSGTAVVGATSRTVQIGYTDVPSAKDAASLAERAAQAWQTDTSAWLDMVSRLRADGEQPAGLTFDVTVTRIGDWVMGGVPMEAFSRTALDAADRLGSPTAFLRGYTNGYYGYLPTSDQLPLGGYEALWFPVVYGLDTGLVLPLRHGSAELVGDTFVDLAQQLSKDEG